MVKEISDKDLEKIMKEDILVIDCYATWCGPCRMLSPIIDDLSEKMKEVKFYKIDVDNNDDIVEKYQIMSIPTILIFKNGKLKNKMIGLRSSEEIMNEINK